jgi:glycosyltransferase involved in cell wall biosynthesis
MKLLWASNAPWAPSGYGGQTLQVVKRIKAAGHDIAIAANYGIQSRMMIDDELLPGVPILPALYDGIGNDILAAHYAFWSKGEPAHMFTLYDVWPYARERFRDIPISSWVPIDHYPVPPQVAEWCKEHQPIAMSKFGQARLKDIGIDSVYIPHAIEKTFSPVDGAREELGWDKDAFVVLINAANKGSAPMRKAWGEMFLATAIFMAAHPDVRLRLHTERIGGQSPDLQQILDASRIDNARVEWTSQYHLKTGQIEPADVARLYSASDVLLATSMGEGFGIPVIEAQACGLPVIVSNWTAQPELVGGGWIADVQPSWDPVQTAYFCTPIISSIVARLEDSYAERGSETVRAAALAKAAEYDADKVFAEGWAPYLAELEARPSKPSRAERRAKRKKAA